MEFRVDANVSGPLVDGRATKALQDATHEIERRTAILGASTVRTELNRVLRTQTPYYRLQIEAQPSPPGWKITDQGVVYGPWLAGLGSRNRTTRFKGYDHWLRAIQEIRRRATQVGYAVVAQFMGRMGGS